MAFQFPPNPIIGQIFTPVSGTDYRWNGTAWYLITTQLTKAEADALYINLAQKAAINGVASLDAGGKVPVAQLPAGVANGVASLDAGAQVPLNQLGNVPAAGGVSVRQTVRFAALDANGYSALLSAGAGLNFNVDAAPVNATLDFAQGLTDSTATLTADAVNQGTLAASNTNYITADYVSASSVTWGSYLIPPQYGYAFDRTQAALLNFEGTNGATTTTDDFGNTWTITGGSISTAQFKFGTSSLLLDGTGDYARTTNIVSTGDGSWEASIWFWIGTNPGVGARDTLFCISENAGGWGARIARFNNGGTIRMEFTLSSNGTDGDISSGGAGTNTTWTTGQWNRVRFVFDALAGTYRAYLSLNGAAETQDFTLSSTARICAGTASIIGAATGGGNAFNGHVDGFRFIRAATVTATETPSASAFTIASAPQHFFSIPAMTMYEATAASAIAGTNPTLTARNRLFVGEQDTGAGTVTATRNYAIRGQYVSPYGALPTAAATKTSLNANIGVPPPWQKAELWAVNTTAADGWKPGEMARLLAAYNAASNTGWPSEGVDGRCVVTFTAGAGGSGAWAILSKTTGQPIAPTLAGAWRYVLLASRGW